MSEQEAVELARRGIELFNANDWDGLAGLLTRDSVYEEIGTGMRTTGPDEFLALCKAWKGAFPDVRGTVTNAIGSGGTAVLEITWEGTHSGDLPAPTGTIPATGKHTVTRAVEVAEVANGKFKLTRQYLDLAGLMAQLGVGVPTPA